MSEATMTENLLSEQDLMISIKGNYFIYVFNSLHPGYFHILFCRLLIFFKINFFRKVLSGNTIRESNSLDPDRDRRFVGPVPGPNFLQNYQ